MGKELARRIASMKRVLVSVEGQTEETFVREVREVGLDALRENVRTFATGWDGSWRVWGNLICRKQ
jgi:hypothetical protein